MTFGHKHLLGIAPLSRKDIEAILDLAETFLEVSARPIKKVPTLRGKTVINFFLEPSTRTRASFEIAAKRLSADAVNLSGSSSSVVKGETLIDTARNLMAMAPDVIVLRHGLSGAPHLMAKHVEASVINAGDGAHEHPTQALLDALTIRKHGKRFDGLEVAICGDIAHSRVARSNLLALTKLGAKVRLVGPHTLLPLGIDALGAKTFHRLEAGIEGADVVMMLRVQRERAKGSPRFPSLREYSRFFGLSPKMFERAKSDALLLHPGPVNWGVELAPELASHPRAVILDQVTSGVAVRMALLYLLGGGAQIE